MSKNTRLPRGRLQLEIAPMDLQLLLFPQASTTNANKVCIHRYRAYEGYHSSIVILSAR
ncbi:hypothetical protein P4637_06570 [Halalkalibacterium halodurans]|uniref:hypothetical protein n=1 Tax=Halalkalibacterium halodurans TaxID=86665 RepID=UPI0012930ED9|nr:hypothetical protein [Halalkalibacterium halodurans]MED4082221.1 hypothetical protein [Halalkalibacterium halodurans]MED4084528.1 hypothetical protein [Halalkalibacterium halodurans]MED4103722.1 hypothetical protein [Halalkalibacterium halodurans]MED4110190.1 hypothetical protein [Halalkalibacterium halodurans]MED4147872.1 hypothetical protein [Halalkalibacterium halodurans]